MVWPVLPPKDQLVRCLLFACMVGSMPAPAQSQSNPDLLSLSIEQLAKTKVYSASRHVEDSRQAPSAVSIITAEDIRRYGWRTLGDALRSLRGFYTSYDRQYTYLGVRGFLRPGDYNSRILLLVNGHRLNDNVYDSAPIGTEFPLDLGIVDRIEIVRGPSSSLFGTNAVFGVINVITRQGASGLSLEASGDVGSFMERSGRLTTSFRHGRVSGLLSGSVYRNAGHSRLYFPEFDSPETNHGIAVDVDGDRSGEAFSDLQLGRVRVQGLFSSRTKVMPTGAYQAIFNDPANMVTDARAYVDVSYHRITSLGDFDLRTYYDRYEYLGSGAFARPNPADRTLARSWAGARWVGAEATLERQIGHHRIVAGGDYEYNLSVEQKNVIIGQPPFFDDRRQPSRAAGYGELELYPGSKLSVRLGARLDWFDIYGKSLSPRVALVYSPNYRTSLKYIYGQAFRAPNAYESYFADGIVIVAPGSPLKPETMRSHELIYDRGLTSWLRITVDASYNHLHDLIDQVPDPATGLTHFVNVGRDRGRAIDT
jgi:iron complex outermembrane receptor protein